MSESSQKTIQRRRPERTQFLMEVATEGAIVKKELPFIVGVIADLSGDSPKDDPTCERKPLRDTPFTGVDRDNFDDVMQRISPQITVSVANRLTGDNTMLRVPLKITKMDDFLPANVARQVEPLRRLLEIREKLGVLLTKVDRSPRLEDLLEAVLQDTEKMSRLANELGVDAASSQKEVE